MKLYAGIGSRETPEAVCGRMSKLATILEGKGYTLRSGGAEGADKAFESGVRSTYNRLELLLPRDPIPMWCDVLTQHFHPNPYALKEFPRKLMNRNAMQILGRDGNTPVEFVVCWTKDGKASGGTGQALRIAGYFGIPVYNFYDESEIKDLKERIRDA